MSATSRNPISKPSSAPDLSEALSGSLADPASESLVKQPSGEPPSISPDRPEDRPEDRSEGRLSDGSLPAEQPPSSPETPKPMPKFLQVALGINVAIAALVLGKSLLDPTVGQPRPFELAESVDLEQWTLTESEPLEPFSLITGEADYSDEGRRYTYTLTSPTATELDKPATLTIELRYMLDTNGFIERLLMGHKEFQNTLSALSDQGIDTSDIVTDIEYQPGIGHSGRFQIQEDTYLNACINPRGDSTFFIDQFHHNQRIHDHDPTRLFSVLFGREVWTDQRCLWTHMILSPGASDASGPVGSVSTASDGSKTGSRDQQVLLEDAWAEWHDIWQPQFPNR